MKDKVIALDVGGTNTRAALIDGDGRILRRKVIPTVHGDPEKFLESVKDIILSLNPDFSEIRAIGAGVPGVLDRRTGFVHALPNIGVTNVPLGKFLRDTFHLKAYIRNDAEVACLAEAKVGAGKDLPRVFFITISTGLGGALCVDGKNQDYVTEIGHTVYLHHGRWTEYEPLASGTGIRNLAREKGLEVKDAEEFFSLYLAGNEAAKEAYAEWRGIMKSFIRMIMDSYHPDVITLTGGVMRSHECFFNDLRKDSPDARLVHCRLHEDAGLIGAALYAFSESGARHKD